MYYILTIAEADVAGIGIPISGISCWYLGIPVPKEGPLILSALVPAMARRWRGIKSLSLFCTAGGGKG
jgi:hypothetical protein